MRLHELIGVVLVVCCTACSVREVITEPKDNCQPEATRCRDTVAEVCGSDQRWVVIADCAALSAQDEAQDAARSFVCCTTPEGHTCLPECP